MASAVDICNIALTKLGAERIASLGENNESARACNLMYQFTRDAELRSHPWNFAIKRAQLAEDANPPSFGYAASFTLPSDFLRLLPPDPAYNFNTHDWQIEGRKILTNETSLLDIRYVARITDTEQFDSLFVHALGARLAVEICEQLTQSNTKAQIMRDDYKEAIRTARKLNAFENIPAESYSDTWITARI